MKIITFPVLNLSMLLTRIITKRKLIAPINKLARPWTNCIHNACEKLARSEQGCKQFQFVI